MSKIIGNTTATPNPIGNLSNLKTKNKNSLVDAINEAAESVSYSQTQNLTDDQKRTARENIDTACIYVKSSQDEASTPAYELHLDLTADASATASEITEETNNEIPTCLAVKNYIASVLAELDGKLQELL